MIISAPLQAQERCEHVPVEDGSAYGCVRGSGGVAIVLAARAGLSSGTWDGLLSELSAFGRVVTFDRPGLGQGAPVSGPRTPTRIAREIRRLLSTLSAPGPFMLAVIRALAEPER
jgi:pimeloyl-ACP methyl ester carboxylesterase